MKTGKLLLSVLLFLAGVGAGAGRWLEGWPYRRELALSPATTAANYQVTIDLTTNNFDYSKASANGDDLRFVNLNDNQQNYWIENWNTSGASRVWLKVSETGTSLMYLYYGNAAAPPQSSVSNTFVSIIAGLVGSWSFDENAGTKAYDTSGKGNTGTLYRATWTNGVYGSALYFNEASNAYVDAGSETNLNLIRNFTIDAWIKTTNWLATHFIVAKSSSYTVQKQYALGVIENGQPNSALQAYVGGVWIGGANGIANGAYRHVALVVPADNTNTALYRDGTCVLTSDTVISNYTTANNVLIGASRTYANNDANTGNAFDGVIDEVHIYDQALAAVVISNLYNNRGYSTTNYPGNLLVRKSSASEPVATLGAETILPSGNIFFAR